MKIQYIQISNILSFKYIDNFDDSNTKIRFEAQDEKDIHILIGPNGGGKSNLLEVITQVFTNMLSQKRFEINMVLNKIFDITRTVKGTKHE